MFDNTPADAFFPFGGLSGDVPVVGAWTGGKTRVDRAQFTALDAGFKLLGDALDTAG